MVRIGHLEALTYQSTQGVGKNRTIHNTTLLLTYRPPLPQTRPLSIYSCVETTDLETHVVENECLQIRGRDWPPLCNASTCLELLLWIIVPKEGPQLQCLQGQQVPTLL